MYYFLNNWKVIANAINGHLNKEVLMKTVPLAPAKDKFGNFSGSSPMI